MNIIAKTIIAAAALLPASIAAQNFDEIYNQADKARTEFNTNVYTGAVTPAWKDNTTFLFRTLEKDGEKYYALNVDTHEKTAATKEEYDSLMQKRRRPYDPSDESPYAMHRDRKPIASPDSSLEASIKDNNVWVGDRQLSFDGTDLWPYTRIMWSPDSKKIAATRKQKIEERQITLRDSRPADQVQPKYKNIDYAKPGDALAQTEVVLFDVEKGKIAIDNTPFGNQYFLELGQWAPDSKSFTFEYNQRGHQVYQLVSVDAENGQTSVLADENTAKYDYKFIYYYDIYRYYLKDGRILWSSERDGYRHLYMIDPATGKNTQLTKGDWNVREVHKVDEDGNYILLSVNGLDAKKGEDPYNKHVCRLDLATGKLVDLTPENATHIPYFNEDFSVFVDNYSRPDLPNTAALRSAKDGKVLMEIQKQDISEILANGFVMPEVFRAKGRDGKTDIWGTIYRPRNYDPKKKYPVVEYIYAGPHDSHVEKNFMTYGSRNLTLCELGFVVVTIDGMGTDNRSRAFQDVCWQNLKDGGFPDRILWMQAMAKKYKNLDISNVGIYGYSAGGQNTMSALLFYPDFYKVGVSLCGCHDNRMDKIWWNEQWMGYPLGPWYSENSNVDNAHLLQGKLFIINGEIDDNVDPASSLQVVNELIKADKDFRQLYLPGRSHNLGEGWITKRAFQYFYENIIEPLK